MALIADMGGPIFIIMGCGVLVAGILLLVAIVLGGYWIVKRMKKNPNNPPPGDNDA